GASPGLITLGNFNLTGALNQEIDGDAPGSEYDQVVATGGVTLSGNLNLAATHMPTIGDTYIIIDKTSAGPVSGEFAGLAQGSTINSGGNTYQISYSGGDGNDVVLTALTGIAPPSPPSPDPEPEPGTDPPPAPKVTQGASPSPTGSMGGPSLSWPHVAGSNFYRIYRAACPTCPKTQVGRVPDTSFIDESALPGLVYYYFVRTENPGGLSDYSDWVPAWRYEQNPGRGGDFNGDGVVDLLWWEADGNQLKTWFMNGGEVQSVSAPGEALDIGQWLLINTGDFNNDGVCDLLWWNPESGLAQVWYLSAAQGASTGGMAVQATADAGDITGNVTLSYTGDINGDGRTDIVWRDYATGQVTLWLMGSDGKPSLNGPPTLGPGMSDGGKPGVSGSLDWALRGVADMNADGKGDLVWQHATDGRVVVWNMGGAQASGLAEYQRDNATNWRVAGLGDMDGDVRRDIIWRNDVSGQVQAWLLRSGEPRYEERELRVSADAPTAWLLNATGDFCGDGCAEIYFKKEPEGEKRIVTLDGQAFTPGAP
ncbi:MAG: VCBS repeat-containing protein, partial [Pseudomonadota bacterium]